MNALENNMHRFLLKLHLILESSDGCIVVLTELSVVGLGNACSGGES
jgi:hypothetical protein